MMEPPILITGCARSGTSLTAGVIAKCGAFGGKVTGPTRWNPKGQFENNYIRDLIVKPYLQDVLGVDKLGQWPLPDVKKLMPFTSLRGTVEHRMREEGYTGGPWYYKGAKVCLIWPVWHEAFPDATWVIVRRADEEIVSSCLRTNFMRAFDNAQDWQIWVDQHKKRFEEICDNMFGRVHIVDINLFIKKPSLWRGFVERLGLDYDERAVADFVDPTLFGSSK